MYYQKYFSGTAAAQSGNLYCIKKDRTRSTTTLISTYGSLNRTKIMCDAMVEVLKDIGFDAKSGYDIGLQDCPYIFLDYENSNVGFYLFYGATSTTASTAGLRCKVGYGDRNSNYDYILPGSSTNYSMFEVVNTSAIPFATQSYSSQSAYAFAITVKGEPKGACNIYIGAYSKPYAEAYGKTSYANIGVISIKRFINLLTQDECWGINPSLVVTTGDQVTTPAATVEWRYYANPIEATMDLYPAVKVLANINTTTQYTYLSTIECQMQDNFINLVPIHLSYPQFKLKEGYYYGGLPTNDEFYEIDGDVYYRLGRAAVKCTTEPSPS